ncbi:MAG: DNA polymerase IV [Pseudomonadota bacterium]|nr:DNA polymerase IV [Pseudomonadota bacterium]
MRRSEGRAILHIDMDAFYASVEEHDRPELRGKPLIVGGTSGRGVVAAANYVVRRFGVRSAMSMRDALRRCPEVICVKPRMARYKEISDQVFAIFRDFTPLVEGLSLDEAFLDVTASQRLLGGPEIIGAEIRRRIAAQTGLTASVGIASNKLLAKIASDLLKPDGMCRIGPDHVHDILDALPIEKLFGVGQKSLPRVHAAGIRDFGGARRADDEVLWRAFGRHGKTMRDRASGIDDRPVEAQREEKSISSEETFATDIRAASLLRMQLLQLADRTASRLRAHELMGGTVNIKIRRADFTTYTRQRAMGAPTHDTAAVAATARSLLDEWLLAQPNAAVRLLGVGISGLQTLRQADLFTTSMPAKNSQLDSAIDGIRERFGAAMVTRASLVARRPRGSGSGSLS